MSYGAYVHRATVEHPGEPVDNGDGGVVVPWVPAVPPDWYCSIEPLAAPRDERAKAGTVIAQAFYTVRGHYRPDITTRTRLIVHNVQPADRVFAVVGVAPLALQPVTLELEAVEVVA